MISFFDIGCSNIVAKLRLLFVNDSEEELLFVDFTNVNRLLGHLLPW